MKIKIALGICAGMLIAGCASQETSNPHLEGIQKLWPEASTDEIDEMAESLCGIVEIGQDMDMTNEEALDLAYNTVLDIDMLDDVDSFAFTTFAIGGWCPMDIRE